MFNFLLFPPAATGGAGGRLPDVGGRRGVDGQPWRPASLLGLDVNFGDALMVIAVLVYAYYTVALKQKPNVHWISLMTVLTGAATVSAIPAAIELALGNGVAPDATGWAIILFTAIFPSILGQIFYVRGALIGANRAGLFINLVPIFGTVLSIIILREDFHLYHAIALALTLGGIWLAEVSGSGERFALRALHCYHDSMEWMRWPSF